MEVIAHRGRSSPNQIGNSLNNFISAYNLGVSGIETDISFTRDNKVIIYHPNSTYPDLSKMSWNEIESSIFKIMNLNDFLMLLKHFPNMICCLDIKQNSPKLVEKAVEMVLDKGLYERVYFTAFEKRAPWMTIESDVKLLMLAKDICANVKIQIISTTSWDLVELAEEYLPDAISLGWLLEPTPVRLITKSLFKVKARTLNFKDQIAELRKRRIKVWAGIFNDPKDIDYFIDLGVNGIFTDNPSTVFELIRNKKISL